MRFLYFWSKKIHRWMMWVTIVLGLIMAVTGLLMEFSNPIYLIRQIHGEFGKYLAFSLLIMAITGLMMWYYPIWIKSQQKKTDSDQTRA